MEKTIEHVITADDIANFPGIFSFSNPEEMIGQTVMVSEDQAALIAQGVQPQPTTTSSEQDASEARALRIENLKNGTTGDNFILNDDDLAAFPELSVAGYVAGDTIPNGITVDQAIIAKEQNAPANGAQSTAPVEQTPDTADTSTTA